MNSLVYVDVIENEKSKHDLDAFCSISVQCAWIFFFYKYSKFWSISSNKKVDLKPLFSEECDSNGELENIK